MANAVLPGTLGEACELAQLPWGHISSGCIYRGRRSDGGAFQEEDPPNFTFRSGPCSFYSGTKAMGEELIRDRERCYTWRLRMPFDHRNMDRNYLSKLLRYPRLLDAENSLSHLGQFVEACLDCWMQRMPFGVYNIVNSGSITTRRVTELLRKHLVPERSFDFFRDEAEFMQLAAKTFRSNCVLDNRKILELGAKLSSTEDAIVQCLEQWS